MDKKSVVVLGGGIGGLSAGWFLARSHKYDVTVIEKASSFGGLCGTFRHEDFTLDYGPHKWYSAVPGITEEVTQLLGSDIVELRKRNRIYLFNDYLDYPFRMGAVLTKMGLHNIAKVGFGTVESFFKRSKQNQNLSYEDFIIGRFGRGMYDIVFRSLAEKTWGKPDTLSSDIAQARLPSKSLLDVVFRALNLKKESELTNAEYFYYPQKGFAQITDRIAEEIKKLNGTLLDQTEPVEIKYSDQNQCIHEVCVMNRKSKRKDWLKCDVLISAIPLPSFIKLLGSSKTGNAYNVALSASNNLEYRSVILVYLMLNQSHVIPDHWIFFPGDDIMFSRIFEQKNLSSQMIPDQKTVIGCDFTDVHGGPFWTMDDEMLIQRCVHDLKKVGLIKGDQKIEGLVKKIPSIYPRYDLHYKEKLNTVFNFLTTHFKNVICTGRAGAYNYNNADHCVDMGKFITEALDHEEKPFDILRKIRSRVEQYRIVD